MIKLPKPVEFSDVIKPVELACGTSKNKDVIAIGNGLNRADGSVSPVLRHAHLKTALLDLKCAREYKLRWFSSKEICAQGKEKRGVCGQDLGGPLVFAKNGALVGLASLIPRECGAGKPQGFTSIPLHLQWIEEVTGIYSCQ